MRIKIVKLDSAKTIPSSTEVWVDRSFIIEVRTKNGFHEMGLCSNYVYFVLLCFLFMLVSIHLIIGALRCLFIDFQWAPSGYFTPFSTQFDFRPEKLRSYLQVVSQSISKKKLTLR